MITNRNLRGLYIFNMNASYKPGDVVYFDGMLYQATTNSVGVAPTRSGSGFVEWIKYEGVNKEQALNIIDSQFIYRGEIAPTEIDTVTKPGIYKVSNGEYNGIAFTKGWLRITPTSEGNFIEFSSDTHNFIRETPTSPIKYTDITKNDSGEVESNALSKMGRTLFNKVDLQGWIKRTVERKVKMSPEPITASGRQFKVDIAYRGDMILVCYKVGNKYSSEVLTALVESDRKGILSDVQETASEIILTLNHGLEAIKGIVFKSYGS